MISRGKATGGALLLCGLALCMFGAAIASAAGMTGVKCEKVGGEHEFKTSQCITGEGSGEFATVPIEGLHEGEGKATTFSHTDGSTSNPSVILHSVIAGVKVTITCGKMSATGQGQNIEEGGEMTGHATKVVHNYSECHAHPETSPEKICDVQGVAPTATGKGELKTTPLTGIGGPNHVVTVQPEGGTIFTKFQILTSGTGCFTKSVLPVEVTGQIQGRADTTTHSHLTFNAETNGTKLIVNGGATPATITATTVGWLKGKPEEFVAGTTF